MTETAIKANERESIRLFERGVAAARGGQRRVAAGLLARAVQLNPRHEPSWLWLSGMLDEPKEIAFCLRSVLEINPHNERARQGLAWLEQRSQIPQPVQEPVAVQAPVEPIPIPAKNGKWWNQPVERIRTVGKPDEAVMLKDELHARHHGESWWVNFRRSRQDMSRVRLFLWVVPVLLLLLTLTLNMTLREAVERNEVLAREAATAIAIPTPQIEQQPARQAVIVLTELPPTQDAHALAYLSALEEPRAQLRQAVEDYRIATSKPGGTSTIHAAAARRLRDSIESAYTVIEGLNPPPVLEQSHAYYLSGLETELAALDDILAFYSSFSVELANRATLRLAEADRYLERARISFEQRRSQITVQVIAPFTVR